MPKGKREVAAAVAEKLRRDQDPYASSRFTSVVERDDEWIAQAVHFTASIFSDRANRTEECASLLEAGAKALIMEAMAENSRKALVYAVTERGHAAVVPRERWEPVVMAELARRKSEESSK